LATQYLLFSRLKNEREKVELQRGELEIEFRLGGPKS
jgi:hypothetical protein